MTASSNFCKSISTLPSLTTFMPQPISTPTVLGTTLLSSSITVPIVHPLPAWQSGIILILQLL
ncbi:Uncharacterised protein [Segatella copri]|nr:Uncharacterised protein [Segatella copri]